MKRFTNENHTILLGDVIDVLESEAVPDQTVDLVFADPPYNIGKNFNGLRDRWSNQEAYCNWITRWLDLCVKKLKPKGSLYLMCATQCFAQLDIILQKHLTILSRIVWHYDSSGVQAKKYFGSLWEPIFHCVKDSKDYVFNAQDILIEARTGAKRKLIDYRKPVPSRYNEKKVPGNTWYFPRVRYRMPEYENHPTQKPLSLLERIVAASSNPGNIVLDPFAGTFSTAHAAAKLGRKSVSIEINEEYVEIGLRRLGIAEKHKGKVLRKPIKSYGGKYSRPAETFSLFEK